MPVLWEQINYTRVGWLDVCCPHPYSRVFFPSITSCYRIKAFCVVFISDFSVSFLYLLPNPWCFITATQSTFRNPLQSSPRFTPFQYQLKAFFAMLVTMGATLGWDSTHGILPFSLWMGCFLMSSHIWMLVLWVVVLSGDFRGLMGAMALLEEEHHWSEASSIYRSPPLVVCSPSLLPVDGDVTAQLPALGTCYCAISCHVSSHPGNISSDKLFLS